MDESWAVVQAMTKIDHAQYLKSGQAAIETLVKKLHVAFAEVQARKLAQRQATQKQVEKYLKKALMTMKTVCGSAKKLWMGHQAKVSERCHSS